MSSGDEESRLMLMEITGVNADVAENLLKIYDLSTAVELASAPDFDARMYAASASGSASAPKPQTDEELARQLAAQDQSDRGGEEQVRAPIPSKTERLYDGPPMPVAAFGYQYGLHSQRRQPEPDINAFEDEAEKRNVRIRRLLNRGEEQPSSKGLGSLFSAPTAIMFKGGFQAALQEAQTANKWILLNLQSNEEFASHQLNRDTWSDSSLSSLISSTFIFVQSGVTSEDGQKIQTSYKLYSLPAIAVIDPITGSAMLTLTGFHSAERLTEALVPYLDHDPEHPDAHRLAALHKVRARASQLKPKNQAAQPAKVMTEDEEMAEAIRLSMSQTAASPTADAAAEDSLDGMNDDDLESESEEAEPLEALEEQPLARDPAEVQREALNSLPPESECSGPQACRVRVRLPDGKNVTRWFMKAGSLSQLRSFCVASSLDAAGGKKFDLVSAGPGKGKAIDEKETFEGAGLANSVVSMVWS